MQYFSGCRTLDEAKKRHRQLLLKYHPDMMNRITREILAEWEQVQADALPDGRLPDSYREDKTPEVIYVDREVPVERIVYQNVLVDRIVYRDRVVYRTVERVVPVEKIVERVVIEYRGRDEKPFDDGRRLSPDRYFMHNGMKFQPSLNEREADYYWRSGETPL